MRSNKLLIRFSTLLLLALLWSCNPRENVVPVPDDRLVLAYSHEVLSGWNELFLEVERYAAGYRPGPAPRALAYIGLATYEACVSAMPSYNSIAARYPGLAIPKVEDNKDYHWPTVVNAVHGYLLKRFFANVDNVHYQKIEAHETQNNNLFDDAEDPAVITRSRTYGQDVAAAVWEWSKTDAVGHDAYLDPFKNYDWQAEYDGPGDWVPTNPGPGAPMYGLWGQVRTFAIKESDKLCPPPIPYSENTNSAFFNQAMEVYANTVNSNYESVWVAEFWSDDLINLTFSPGPRFLAIADQVYNQEKSNLETAIYCNAKIGMALNDAAVACWNSKYVYNLERPESYIQRIIDPTWEPILFNPLTNQAGVTPSFPAYPSGHSTMGAAGCEILTDVFGISYALTDRCHENRNEFEGKPRSFSRFYDMAEENAWSRVVLGVHFRMDCEQGVNLGYLCGRRVNAIQWKK
jgi:hypothetical protein